MSNETIEVRASLLDALQVDLFGPSGGHGDHRETLPQAPSRWYLTGFHVPTDADEDQRYDPNTDDEVDQAPAAARVDENQTPEQPASKRFSQLNSSVAKSSSVATTSPELQALDQARTIFQGSIAAEEDLVSPKEGMTDAKKGFVNIV